MLFAAGVDYKNTPIEQRERLAFNDDEIRAALNKISCDKKINGCIILSTCNRSEIYISSDYDIKADRLLIQCAGKNDFKGKINIYSRAEAVYHIMETACGIHSAIKGESQIITQISHSADLSRECGCCGSELDVLFRTAVSTGRRAVCSNGCDRQRMSSAYRAVEAIGNLTDIKGKKCLVIGNGKVGILSARLLKKRGADVTITLRRYRHGENIIPEGCGYIEYSKRADILGGCDILISATKSPHYTVTEDMTRNISLPKYIADLAVPRDIEPSVYENRNIFYFDIDNFVYEGNNINDEIYDIVENGVSEYMGWHNYRESISEIENIKDIIARRIVKSTDLDDSIVKEVTNRVTDIIFGGMKNVITPETIEECYKKIRSRARL